MTCSRSSRPPRSPTRDCRSPAAARRTTAVGALRRVGHGATRRVGHPRRRGAGSGQHILLVLAGVHQLLAGSAAALRGECYAAPGRHAVHLPRRAVFAGVIARRQQDQLHFVRHRSGRAGFSNDRAQGAPAHQGLVLGIGVLQVAAAHPDHGRRGCFTIRSPGCILARSRPARAQQHRAHRLSRVSAARHQGLLRAIQHDHRSGNRICLLPQPRVAVESGFAG